MHQVIIIKNDFKLTVRAEYWVSKTGTRQISKSLPLPVDQHHKMVMAILFFY